MAVPTNDLTVDTAAPVPTPGSFKAPLPERHRELWKLLVASQQLSLDASAALYRVVEPGRKFYLTRRELKEVDAHLNATYDSIVLSARVMDQLVAALHSDSSSGSDGQPPSTEPDGQAPHR